jgi:hypothetical protein
MAAVGDFGCDGLGVQPENPPNPADENGREANEALLGRENAPIAEEAAAGLGIVMRLVHGGANGELPDFENLVCSRSQTEQCNVVSQRSKRP